MSYETTASLILEKNKPQGSFPIYLYEISIPNGTLYYTSNNAAVTFPTIAGNTYNPFPISHNQVETNTKGEISGVQLTITNVDRYVIQLLLANDALRGQKVVILLVFNDSLGDVNNCLRDEYYIDSAQVDENNATFSLTTKFIVDKVAIPTRNYKRDQCQWSFKGRECGFRDTYKREPRIVTIKTSTSLNIAPQGIMASNRLSDIFAIVLEYTAHPSFLLQYYSAGVVTTVANTFTYGHTIDTNKDTLEIYLTTPVSLDNFDALYYQSGSVTATVCNKTLKRCTELGNNGRYGSFPSIPSRSVFF